MNKYVKEIEHRIIVVFFYVMRLFPIQKNKIVISSFAGKGYGSEGRSICEELLKRNCNLDIVWLCDNVNAPFPDGIRTVRYNSFRSVYELATAKIWIDNRRKDIFIRKRKGQLYIQTWHGNVCIKKVEKDAISLQKSYFEKAKADSKMADYFVSGSKWRDKNYRSAFWYNGEIIHGDLYRISDRLAHQSKYFKMVHDFYNIPLLDKIALYAPTFRQDSRLDCYNIDYNRLLKTLHNKYGSQWKLLIRLHPNIANLNQELEYSNDIINASLYPQVYDLIAGTDLLISDYSGVIFDGFHLGKKVILYASDLDRYLKEERDLYFDFRELPSPIARNNDELEDVITSFDANHYENQRKAFVDSIGYYEDDASILVTDILFKFIKEK